MSGVRRPRLSVRVGFILAGVVALLLVASALGLKAAGGLLDLVTVVLILVASRGWLKHIEIVGDDDADRHDGEPGA